MGFFINDLFTKGHMAKRTNSVLNKLHSFYDNDGSDIQNAEDKRSFGSMIRYTIFAQAFGTFTAGAFFTGYALYLGVSDILIGYLANISMICGFIGIFAGYVVQGFKHIKKPYMVLLAICQLLVVFTVWIPLILPEGARIPVFFGCLILTYLLGLFAGYMSNIMLVNLMPADTRGRFYARLQIYTYSIGLMLPLIAALLLDNLGKGYTGFFILYNASLVFLFFELFFFSKVRDVENKSMHTGLKNLSKAFIIPFKNRLFRKFVFEYLLFFIIFNISAIYMDLYVLKYIKISYTFYYIANAVGTLIIIMLVKRSGSVTDRLGGKYGFRLSQYMHIPYVLMFFVLSPANGNIVYILLCIVRAMVTIYYSVGSFKYKYDIIPADGRALYDGFFTSVYSINGILSPMISTFLLKFIQRKYPAVDFGLGQQYKILFIITAISTSLFLIIREAVDKDRPEGSLISTYFKYIKGVFSNH
jgi:MFS family permease